MYKFNGYVFDPLRLIFFKEENQNEIECEILPNDNTAEIYQQLNEHDSKNLNHSKRAPVSGGICISYKCQLACNYCGFNSSNCSSHQSKIENIQVFVDYLMRNVLINQLVSNGKGNNKKILKISFSGGGEPTLEWDVFQKTVEYIVEKCQKNNIQYNLSLTTNGVLDSYKQNFIAKYFDDIMISFDGIPYIQDQNRKMRDGGPTSNIVADTIRFFDNIGTPYSIRTTVWQNDYGKIIDMADYLYSNYSNFSQWSICPVMPQGRGKTNFEIHNSSNHNLNFTEIYFKVYDYIKGKYNIEPNISSPLFLNEIIITVCGSYLGDGPWLFPDNRIVACLDAKEFSPVLGKIVDGEIHNNSKYSDILLETYKNKFIECQSCVAYRFCRGNCPLRFLSHNKKYYDWECEMTRNYWEEIFNRVWRGECCFGWKLTKESLGDIIYYRIGK